MLLQNKFKLLFELDNFSVSFAPNILHEKGIEWQIQVNLVFYPTCPHDISLSKEKEHDINEQTRI